MGIEELCLSLLSHLTCFFSQSLVLIMIIIICIMLEEWLFAGSVLCSVELLFDQSMFLMSSIGNREKMLETEERSVICWVGSTNSRSITS